MKQTKKELNDLRKCLNDTIEGMKLDKQDMVLQALEKYNDTASPQRKSIDQQFLEENCMTDVDAYRYFTQILADYDANPTKYRPIDYSCNEN
jgi:predicted outer membrane protein